MSHGKSLRILAFAALLGAIGYFVLQRFIHQGPASTTNGGTAGGAATGDEVLLAVARETGAAWYCEGDTVQGAWENAQEALERVARSPHASPQDLVNLACVKLRLWADDQQKQAAETPAIRELCRKALERDPKLATAHYLLGAVAMDRDVDVAAAKAAFEQAVACAPDDVPAKLRLADALNESGERDRAIELYTSVRSRGPEFAGPFYMTATYRLAQLLRQRRQGDDRDRSVELLTEHRKRSEEGAANPSEQDLRLGNLARVIVPPSRGAARSAPTTAPAVRFDETWPFLVDELASVASVDVADLDSDLRDDLLVAGAGKDGKGRVFTLLQDETGRMKAEQLCEGSFTRVMAVDLENEFGMNLLLLGDGAARLFSPEPNGKGGWVDATAQLPPLPKVVNDVQPVDFGHDGNVDLALATSEGLKLIRNDGVPRDQFTRDRTDAVQLKDVSAEAGLPTNAIAWVAIEDFDSDQDIDLLVGGPGAPTTVISNLRKGRFEAIAPERSGLPREIAREPLLADLDHDGRPDAFVPGDPPGFARNKAGGGGGGEGTFEAVKPLPEIAHFWKGPRGGEATLADVDLDGELDLVGVTAGGGLGVRFGALTSEKGVTLMIDASSAPGAAPRLADLDDDGDFDLVTLGDEGQGGIVVRSGSVGGSPSSLLLQLRGVKDNRQAIGAIVELRALEHYERRLALDRKQLLGLGSHASADVVRITWPNGVVQCLVSPTSTTAAEKPRGCGGSPRAEVAAARRATILAVAQKEGLVGSCPFLYAWNGETYGFVSDVLGITPLGLPMTESMYVPPDHDELVRVTSDQLKPKEGEYRLQLTEELREVTFLDRAELWVVDHPADVEVHPEERFCFPPFPPLHLHTVKDALPLVKAIDQAGRDWTDALAREDRVHAVPFTPLDSRYLGLVTSHWLELTLPESVKSAKKVRLLMSGWLYWTDASVNVLADRNGSIHFVPPLISVPDGNGGWRETGPPVGFPAGKTKTMVLDVTSMLNRADPRLRIFSTIRLYWDQIRVAVDDDDVPLEVTKLDPAKAELWPRGFSAPIACEADDQPVRFEWSHLEPTARWNQHAGMLTRLGDVVPLLQSIDDRFVILSAGDAIDLRFDAKGVAPLPPDRARTFLLFVDGWAKDADPNTTFSQTVEPLPFHAMSGYPYRPDERYPDDADHVDYRLEWNTRPARRLIPSLAPLWSPAVPESP